MLEKYFNLDDIKLRKNCDIDKYPRACERECWELLSEETKAKFIKKGEKYLNYDYPSFKAINYLKLYTENSRDPYILPYYNRRSILSWLVIAECIEHKGRFIDDIINGIYLICSETTWIHPAHALSDYAVNTSDMDILPNSKNKFIDLYAAWTGQLMAWVYFLLKKELDEVSPLICQYIKDTLDDRIINPYLDFNNFWWLTFGNNWNTWINNEVLRTATIMVDEEEKFKKIVKKSVWSIDRFFKEFPYDGGCEEGAHYWHSNVAHDYLKWLKYITFNKINPFEEEQLKNISNYEVNMYVGKNNYATVSDTHLNFTDQHVDDICEIAELSDNENLKKIASERGKNVVSDSNEAKIQEILKELFPENDWEQVYEKYKGKEYKFDKSFWYDSIETAIWREKDTVGGLYFTIKGGHNEELHNHNDVGNFILFNNCEPVIIDAGIGEYTNQAFSPQRYEIWSFNSKYHNVPYIGGTEQIAQRYAKAVNVSHSNDSVSMDIAQAYADESIIHWIRNVRYDRETNEILFTEKYEFTEEKEFSLHFMLRKEPVIHGSEIILEQNIVIRFEDLAPDFEEVEGMDSIMKKNWGQVFRLKLSGCGKCGTINYKIMKEN